MWLEMETKRKEHSMLIPSAGGFDVLLLHPELAVVSEIENINSHKTRSRMNLFYSTEFVYRYLLCDGEWMVGWDLGMDTT